jgi:hypothetical protein
VDVSCGYQMLWNLILIRYQSYEEIQLVIAFPNVGSEAYENNSDTNIQYIINITLPTFRRLGRKKLCVLLQGKNKCLNYARSKLSCKKHNALVSTKRICFSRMELILTQLRSYKGIHICIRIKFLRTCVTLYESNRI